MVWELPQSKPADTSGAVDFITKPFNPDILLSKVRIFLRLDLYARDLESLVDTKETKAFTAKEKLKQLEDKNPAIKNLRQTLDLRLDE